MDPRLFHYLHRIKQAAQRNAQPESNHPMILCKIFRRLHTTGEKFHMTKFKSAPSFGTIFFMDIPANSGNGFIATP